MTVDLHSWFSRVYNSMALSALLPTDGLKYSHADYLKLPTDSLAMLSKYQNLQKDFGW